MEKKKTERNEAMYIYIRSQISNGMLKISWFWAASGHTKTSEHLLKELPVSHMLSTKEIYPLYPMCVCVCARIYSLNTPQASTVNIKVRQYYMGIWSDDNAYKNESIQCASKPLSNAADILVLC